MKEKTKEFESLKTKQSPSINGKTASWREIMDLVRNAQQEYLNNRKELQL